MTGGRAACHVQDLLGRRVVAMNGRPIGRIEEIRTTCGRGGRVR